MLAQRAVQLRSRGLPGLVSSLSWSQPEHGDWNPPQFLAMPLEESVGVAVPAPRVQRGSQHDQIPTGQRPPHRPSRTDVHGDRVVPKHRSDHLSHLSRRSMLGGIDDQDTSHADSVPVEDEREMLAGADRRLGLDR